MKLFQKKGVAILVMVLAIALASVWGISHRPVVVTPEGGEALDTSLSTAYYREYIVDNANVLSENTEEALAVYDANWDEWSGSILAVVAEPFVSSTTEEAAWDWADRLKLGENDAILLLAIQGQDAYLLSSGDFRDRFGGTESNYLGAYLYEDFMAGNYDDGVENLFANIHLLFHDNAIVPGTNNPIEVGGLAVLLILLLVLVFSWMDQMRYNTWYRRYGGMPVPPVVFRPILWWHRPGGSWWRRRRPPRPERRSSASIRRRLLRSPSAQKRRIVWLPRQLWRRRFQPGRRLRRQPQRRWRLLPGRWLWRPQRGRQFRRRPGRRLWRKTMILHSVSGLSAGETRQTGRFSLNLQIVQSPGLSTH